MTVVRLGAVEYLNARPLVFGLERSPDFSLRFDVPSRCADLLHARETDVGLIPSIEYLRGPGSYHIVPGPAVTSNGAVASVALFTSRDPRDIRTIAMDTSSRTSVALATVLAKRAFGITPRPVPAAPDLAAMLAVADAALLIGDNALFLDHQSAQVRKIDLGELWTRTTGLPFVYAFWAGWPDAIAPTQAAVLRRAGGEGASHTADIARVVSAGDGSREVIVARYLRDNIQYRLGPAEQEGLTRFLSYAAEDGLVSFNGTLSFYHADDSGTR